MDDLAKLGRDQLLSLAERLSEQNRILQSELRNRTARLQDREVRIKAFHLLLLLVQGDLRRRPEVEPLLEQVDGALSWSDLSGAAFPELGFAKGISGVERCRDGSVRASVPGDGWAPPFDALTFEQAAAYIDAELEGVSAEWRVSWWTSELDDFDGLMPVQILEAGRYRELWEYAASMNPGGLDLDADR